MQLTRTATIRSLRIATGILLAGVIVAYSIWRSLNYARGPHILLYEPNDGSSIAASTVTIRGKAERVNALFVNGQSIAMDEQGGFTDTLIVFPGMNVIAISANDQFGRTTQIELDLIGTVGFPAPQTTTPSTPSIPTSTAQ